MALTGGLRVKTILRRQSGVLSHDFGHEFDFGFRRRKKRDLKTVEIDEKLIIIGQPSEGRPTPAKKFAFSRLWIILA